MNLPLGFSYASLACGIKKGGDPDLALIFSEGPCAAAALFTQNRFAAASVQYDRRLLALHPGGVQAVLINSGNANAVTGAGGMAAARRSAEAVERVFGLSPWSTLIMSTGVIGVPLPVERIEAAIPALYQGLRADEEGLQAAARAIMTTDTRPKMASMRLNLGEGEITVTGIAKGAGMIHPNMATMLAAIVTDAALSPELLALALRQAVDRSFNRISVDGDTSTNDTVVALANGAAGGAAFTDPSSPAFVQFSQALSQVAGRLAQAIVRDGEGATRLVTVQVSGLAGDEQAHRVANAIALSSLVKTAIYGGDANWGRILAAAGSSGVDFDPNQAALWIEGESTPNPGGGPLQLVADGVPLDYEEAEASAHFACPELRIILRLGPGPGRATMWTCDLSHDYVTINGMYRT